MRALFLIVLLATGSAPYAQEQGGASNAPVEEIESADSSQSSERPPFPIVMVETPDQAQHGGEREAKSDQHESDDLAAQQKAADAAERSATASEWQVIPAYWQAILATIGAVGLIYSLYLTRRSLLLTQETVEGDQRPYLSMRDINIIRAFDAAKEPIFVLTPMFVNFGRTPARVSKVVVSTRVAEPGESVDSVVWADDAPGEPEIHILPPTVAMATSPQDVPVVDLRRVSDGALRLLYRYYFEYRGRFPRKEPYKTAVVFEVNVISDPSVLHANPKMDASQSITFTARQSGSVST